MAASRSQLLGTVGNTLQSAFANVINQKMAYAQVKKINSENEYQDIVNKFAYADLFGKIRKQIAEAKDTETRQQYQEILNYILDSSKEDAIMKNHSDAVNAFNQTTLMDDEHSLNVASLRSKHLEAELLEANLAWLPREKAASIAQVYAQAYASTMSGKAAAAAAENYAADTYGKKFDNKMRDTLHDIIEKSETSRYQSQDTTLAILKQQLVEAKKNNNTYEIRLIGDLITKLLGSAGSAAVGGAAVKKVYP